jgi:hypothetical protein
MYSIGSSAEVEIDSQGIIQITNDEFAAAVDEVEATRIRECEICKRTFWAGRITQHACSTACAHALRNRRYRARYREGFYQGARLTDKEKSAHHQQKRKSNEGD